jgi:5,5'-dehydrodivanillate O-demethylase
MLSVGWFFSRVPAEREPYLQKRIPYWVSPVKDPQTGRWITSHLMNQDFVAWAGQGTVADRAREHLGRSDRGVIMMRRRFLADLELIAKGGGDPKAVIRDSGVNKCVSLPVAGREAFTRGVTREQRESLGRDGVLGGAARRDFAWLAGQPAEVGKAYRNAMGQD